MRTIKVQYTHISQSFHDREIIYEWAEGNELCNKVWEKRYDLQYFPSGYVFKK